MGPRELGSFENSSGEHRQTLAHPLAPSSCPCSCDHTFMCLLCPCSCGHTFMCLLCSCDHTFMCLLCPCEHTFTCPSSAPVNTPSCPSSAPVNTALCVSSAPALVGTPAQGGKRGAPLNASCCINNCGFFLSPSVLVCQIISPPLPTPDTLLGIPETGGVAAAQLCGPSQAPGYLISSQRLQLPKSSSLLCFPSGLQLPTPTSGRDLDGRKELVCSC